EAGVLRAAVARHVGAVGRALYGSARAEDVQSSHRPVREGRHHLEHVLGLADRPRLLAGAGPGLCWGIPADLQGVSTKTEGRQLQPGRGAPKDAAEFPFLTRCNTLSPDCGERVIFPSP